MEDGSRELIPEGAGQKGLDCDGTGLVCDIEASIAVLPTGCVPEWNLAAIGPFRVANRDWSLLQ